MKSRVRRLSVLQTGKLMAVLYGLAAAVMFPFMAIGMLGGAKGGGGVMLLMLLLYPVMGFVGGILMAALYNLAAKWVGGIEVTMDVVEPEKPEGEVFGG